MKSRGNGIKVHLRLINEHWMQQNQDLICILRELAYWSILIITIPSATFIGLKETQDKWLTEVPV